MARSTSVRASSIPGLYARLDRVVQGFDAVPQGAHVEDLAPPCTRARCRAPRPGLLAQPEHEGRTVAVDQAVRDVGGVICRCSLCSWICSENRSLKGVGKYLSGSRER